MHGLDNPFYKTNPVKYWEEQNEDSQHNPWRYTEPDQLTPLLFEDLEGRLSAETSFMEIGCGAGRNLQYLWDQGFKNLAGIEINPMAVDTVMQQVFPQLYQNGTFFVGNAASMIREIPDTSYDVVFSKGVLMHIPPGQASLFKDMVRICRRYIVVHTSEMGAPYYYDFEKLFERLGCKLIVHRSFYDHPEGAQLPHELYDDEQYRFKETFLNVFIKKNRSQREVNVKGYFFSAAYTWILKGSNRER